MLGGARRFTFSGMEDGRHLAELLSHYRDHRSAYLAWVADRGYEPSLALPNYRRALVAWYEATIDPVSAYAGDTFAYLTALAGVYYRAPAAEEETFLAANPLDYLPRTIQLSDEEQRLLAGLARSPDCRALLLLSDYHRLEPTAILRATGGTLGDLANRIDDCRQTVGAPGPDSDRWQNVITVAGRQDLISTLEREARSGPVAKAPVAAAAEIPSAAAAVPLTPRGGKFRWPRPATVVAGLLFGVLGWLVYTTFGTATPAALSTDYFEPYPNPFATVAPATEADRDLQRILMDYDRGHYRTAYDELLPVADAYPAAPLYLGVCALALDDPGRAREWLDRIPADSAYRDAADWYDALAILAGGGGAAGAKPILDSIVASPGHPYRPPAAELLSDL